MGYSDKLYEAAASVTGWASGGAAASSYPSGAQQDATRGATSSSSSYWSYASNTLQSALNSSSEAASSLYESIYSFSYPASEGKTATETPIQNTGTFLTAPKTKKPNIGWTIHNPYSNIRGYQNQPSSSLEAVRSLLKVVPVKPEQDSLPYQDEEEPLERQDTASSLDIDISVSSLEHSSQRPVAVSRNETASQLAEGTIRALRDAELDEAMELHQALEYWTLRWARPLLSWLEAGPWVWLSPDGYNHSLVGQRVSQIQAVLARRCNAIGELQQHLLRAGWQKGVAQWGVLGQGGQWANVAGADGAIEEEPRQKVMEDPRSIRRLSSLALEQLPPPEAGFPTILPNLPSDPNAQIYYGNSNLNVNKTIGGSIVVDDDKLAAWSVDGIWVVRDQLYRASIGLVQLPCADNWRHEQGELIAGGAESTMTTQLPVWAARQKRATGPRSSEVEIDTILEDGEEQPVDSHVEENTVLEQMPVEEAIAQTEEKALSENDKQEGKVVITDLYAMALEVSELLYAMENVIEMQRDRRLKKLKGLPLIRRNWYMAALGAPLATYLVYRLLKGGHAAILARFAVEKVRTFFNEHLYEPVSAILLEFFSRRDRDTIIDHKARIDAIESLKKMIASWLEETYGDEFTKEEIHSRAQSMDMSLIEERKEANMKSLYEINSVVRMSFIEMQFIKKELLNALYAIDDMMVSNEINMNLAAVTPAVLLVYLVNKTFRFMFYALLKIRKSREETYSNFRHVLLDMDRLLLMRDNPPSAPPPLAWTENGEPMAVVTLEEKPRSPCVLNADDLGMLMLHIHECRTILWEDRRRFSLQTVRDVAEDLAELAGERGPVSVEQQLQIISRMCRTYPFLKVQGAIGE